MAEALGAPVDQKTTEYLLIEKASALFVEPEVELQDRHKLRQNVVKISTQAVMDEDVLR